MCGFRLHRHLTTELLLPASPPALCWEHHPLSSDRPDRQAGSVLLERRLKPRVVKTFTQGHTAATQPSWNSNLGLIPNSALPRTGSHDF